MRKFTGKSWISYKSFKMNTKSVAGIPREYFLSLCVPFKKVLQIKRLQNLVGFFSFILTEYSPFLLCPSRNKRKNLVLFSQLINMGRQGISSKYIKFLTLWFRLILRRVRWVACQCWSQQSVRAFLPEASLAQNGDSTPSTHLRGVRKEKKWSHEKMRKLPWPDKCPRLT